MTFNPQSIYSTSQLSLGYPRGRESQKATNEKKTVANKENKEEESFWPYSDQETLFSFLRRKRNRLENESLCNCSYYNRIYLPQRTCSGSRIDLPKFLKSARSVK